MTLITNEIHILSGFNKTVLVFAADRRLTYPDGSYAGTRQKLFRIPYLEGGISYFGLAEVYPGGRKQLLSDWLKNFITRHSTTKSLKDFGFQLRDELHAVIPAVVLEKNASGFHICGYNPDGLPEFWFLRNIGTMQGFQYADLQSRYTEPTADFLDRDAKLMGWDGTNNSSIKNQSFVYRNGDFRSHVVAFERLDQMLTDMLSFPDFERPKRPEDWVRFKFEFVTYFYKRFSTRQIIGKPIDAFSLTKTLKQ
jgi:hypothetical protein